MAKKNVGSFLSGFGKKDAPTHKKIRNFSYAQFSGTMTESKVRFLSLRVVKLFRYVSRLFSHASARAYGVLAVAFGITTLALYFSKLAEDMTVVTPILGACVALFATPLLLTEKPVPLFLQDYTVTDYIFFEFFCIKRFNKLETVQSIPLFVPALLGGVLALLGLIFPSWYIVLTLGAILFVGTTLMSPEFALFASFLALPYMHLIPYSTPIFITLIVLSVISFLRKSFFGKRVFYLDVYDAGIALFMLLVLITGIFVKGTSSFTGSLCMLFMGFGYTLSNNVVTNRRLADRAANSVVISLLIPAVMSIVGFIRALADGSAAQLIDKGIYSAFSGRETYAMFMLVALVFAVAMIRQSHGVKKLLYYLAFAVECIALVLTGELFALLALFVGIGVYFIIRAGRATVIILPILLFVPYLVLLLPNSLLDTVFSVIPSLDSAEELFLLFSESLSAFVRNAFVGIGIGAESFAEEMASSGIDAVNSSNLFIEIGLEAGLFALACFSGLLVVRLMHRSSYQIYIKNSDVSTLARICSACIFSLISYGAVSYVFADMYSCYIFWCVFGIGSATLRVAKKETDDRIHYYEDTRASDSSAIDVEIR